MAKRAFLANFGKTKLPKQFDTDRDMSSFIAIVVVLLFAFVMFLKKAAEKLEKQAEMEREAQQEFLRLEEIKKQELLEQYKQSREAQTTAKPTPKKSAYVPLSSVENFNVEGGRLTVERLDELDEETQGVDLGLHNPYDLHGNLRKAIIFKEILDRKY